MLESTSDQSSYVKFNSTMTFDCQPHATKMYFASTSSAFLSFLFILEIPKYDAYQSMQKKDF